MPPRRTAVALLAAGTLALAGCGSDDDATTSTSTASTATTASTTTTAAPTTTSADTTADGGATTVAGTGYGFSVPEGWQDVKSQASSAAGAGASQLDRAYAAPGAAGGFRTNVTTTRSQIPDSVEAAQAVKLTTDNARKQFSATGTVSPNEQTTLDGEPATTYVISRAVQGVDVRQRQVVAVHDGAVYSLTVSYSASEADDGQGVVDEAKRTWSWR